MPKQYILLDIDFAIASGTHINRTLIIRPHVADFIKYIDNYNEQFDTEILIAFYTANDNDRVAEICFCLIDDWGLDAGLVRAIYHRSLHCDNCAMIPNPLSAGVSTMKCLKRAADVLRCKVSQIVCLIDDNPDMITWDYQDKRIICPPFMDEDDNDDTFFKELIERHRAFGKF